MEAVGQLDQHDPDVFRHGNQHLSEAFGIQAVGVVKAFQHAVFGVVKAGVHSGKLGYTVHQLGDFRPEALVDLRQGNAAVFDDVMEEGGDDGLVIEVKIG